MSKKKKLNPMLLKVLIISGLVHVAALLILGSITVVKYIIPDDAQFEEPPAIEEEVPPQEVKVEIKPQAAPQNQSFRNLQMRQVGNISVASVDVDLPSMDQSFTVSAGLGGFSGAGILSGARGSIGLGMSEVSIFGIKSKAERFLFLIDASKEMLEDKKGGLNSYQAIKDEITTMVSNLSTGTLFNVGFYNNGKIALFKQQPVPAGAEVTQELIQWVSPINADAAKLGVSNAQKIPVRSLASDPIHVSIKTDSHGGSGENAYLTQVALEQSIDAVYFITGNHKGFQRLARPHTGEEKAEWAKYTATAEYQKLVKARRAEQVEMKKKVAAKLAQINKQRAAQGLPPKIIHGDAVTALGFKWTTQSPPRLQHSFIEVPMVKKYFKELVEELYEVRGGKAPAINVILFLAGDEKLKEENEESLKDYVRFFDGRYRVIRGLDEIKSNRSAKDTTN